MKNTKQSLSLVIPVYNEAESLPALMSAIEQALPPLSDDFEIILIDDASRDETPRMLDALAEKNEKVRVIHNARNRKLGGTLRAGFNLASRDLVLYFDADLPFDLSEISRALAVMEQENADIVSAFRTNRHIEGPRRTLYTFGYNRLVNLLFGLKLKDVNFSFKLFRRPVLSSMSLCSEGSFINAEIFARAKKAGYKVAQFPVVYLPRKNGRSTLSNVGVILKILDELGRFLITCYGRKS